MKRYLDQQQTAKLIELGFEKPKSVTEISWQEDEKDNPIINANTIEYTRHYSIGELIEMLPSYVEWEGNTYGLRIETECTYSWWVAYEPTQNCNAKIFPVYDGGSCLIDILYNVLINLVALKDELTDIGGHDEYNQGEAASEVFKLKEEGVI